MNEFGLRDHQVRTPYLVKNASVFEVLGATTVQEVMYHGDLSESDIERLTESGRKFLVFWEAHANGWDDWFYENKEIHPVWEPGIANLGPTWWRVNVEEFAQFAKVVVNNYDFTIRNNREVRHYA